MSSVKILVLGSTGVGKTSIIKRFVHNVFLDNRKSTISCGFDSKSIEIGDLEYKIELWDVPLSDRFGPLGASIFKDCVGVMLVLDSSKPFDFSLLSKEIDSILFETGNSKTLPIALVANKFEISVVEDSAQIDSFCTEKHLIGWYEVSAKKNTNVQKVILDLVENILKIQKENTTTSITSGVEMISVTAETASIRDPKDDENFKFPYFDQMPSFDLEHTSHLASVLTPLLFESLKDRQTSPFGFTFSNVILNGVRSPSSTIGVVAGDAASYQVFQDLFYPIINRIHDNYDPSSQFHPSSEFSLSSISAIIEQVQKIVSPRILSTRITVIRNIEQYPFLPGATDVTRNNVQNLILECMKELSSESAGEYIEFSAIPENRKAGVTQLSNAFGISLDRSPSDSSTNRQWPKNRGVFIKKPYIIWVNEDDHIRIDTFNTGGDFIGSYSKFSEFYTLFEQAIIRKGYSFAKSRPLGYLSTCPSNLGTAMKLSLLAHLPEFEKLPTTDLILQVCKALNLNCKSIVVKADTSKFELSSKSKLGVTEFQMMQSLLEGLATCIEFDQLLEKGATPNKIKTILRERYESSLTSLSMDMISDELSSSSNTSSPGKGKEKPSPLKTMLNPNTLRNITETIKKEYQLLSPSKSSSNGNMSELITPQSNSPKITTKNNFEIIKTKAPRITPKIISSVLKTITHRFVYIIESEVRNGVDQSKITCPSNRFLVGGARALQDPRIMPMHDLIGISNRQPEVVLPPGWSKVHEFIYSIQNNTDENGWQYRSTWNENILTGDDEPWSSVSSANMMVRRRLWLTTVVKSAELVDSRQLLSSNINQESNIIIHEGSLFLYKDQTKNWANVKVELGSTQIKCTAKNGVETILTFQGCEARVYLLFNSQFPDSSYSFCIFNISNNSKLILDADSKDSRRMWVNKILYQISIHYPNFLFPSLECGPPTGYDDDRLLYYGELQIVNSNDYGDKTDANSVEVLLRAKEIIIYEGENITGRLLLDSMIIEDDADNQNSFIIYLKSQTSQTLCLRASSLEDKNTWKNIILNQINIVKQLKQIRKDWPLPGLDVSGGGQVPIMKRMQQYNEDGWISNGHDEDDIKWLQDQQEQENQNQFLFFNKTIIDNKIVINSELDSNNNNNNNNNKITIPNNLQMSYLGDTKDTHIFQYPVFETFPTFSDDNHSLLAKVLTADMFQSIANKKTSHNISVSNIIVEGVMNPKATVGVKAGDAECYKVFRKLFNPIITHLHQGYNPNKRIQPHSNFNFSTTILDDVQWHAVEQRVSFICFSISRNLDRIPFLSGATNDHVLEVEQVFHHCIELLGEDFSGEYLNLDSLTEEQREFVPELSRMCRISMDPQDRANDKSGINRLWPNHRGLFIHSLHPLLVWINDEDHMKMITTTVGCDFTGAFDEFSHLYHEIETAVVKTGHFFERSNAIGYLNSCPSNLGTGLTISVAVDLPEFAKALQSAIMDEDSLDHSSNLLNDACHSFGVKYKLSVSDNTKFDIISVQKMGITEGQTLEKLLKIICALIEIDDFLETQELLDYEEVKLLINEKSLALNNTIASNEDRLSISPMNTTRDSIDMIASMPSPVKLRDLTASFHSVNDLNESIIMQQDNNNSIIIDKNDYELKLQLLKETEMKLEVMSLKAEEFEKKCTFLSEKMDEMSGQELQRMMKDAMKEKEIINLKQKVSILENNSNQLQNNKDEEMDELKNKINNYIQNEIMKENEMNELKNKINNLQNNCIEKENQIKDFKNSLHEKGLVYSEKEFEIKELKQNLYNNNNNNILQKETEINELKMKIKEYIQNISNKDYEVNELRKKVNDFSVQVSLKDTEIINANNKINEWIKIGTMKDLEINELQNKANKNIELYLSKNVELNELKNKNVNVVSLKDTEITELKHKLTEQMSINEQHAHNLNLNLKIQELEAIIALKSNVETSNSNNNQDNNLKEELIRKEFEIKILSEKLIKSESQLNILTKEKVQINEDNLKFQSIIESLNQSKISAENQEKLIKEHNQERELLLKKITNFSKKSDELQKELSLKNNQLIESNLNIEQYKREANVLNEILFELQQKYDELVNEHSTKSSELKDTIQISISNENSNSLLLSSPSSPLLRTPSSNKRNIELETNFLKEKSSALDFQLLVTNQSILMQKIASIKQVLIDLENEFKNNNDNNNQKYSVFGVKFHTIMSLIIEMEAALIKEKELLLEERGAQSRILWKEMDSLKLREQKMNEQHDNDVIEIQELQRSLTDYSQLKSKFVRVTSLVALLEREIERLSSVSISSKKEYSRSRSVARSLSNEMNMIKLTRASPATNLKNINISPSLIREHNDRISDRVSVTSDRIFNSSSTSPRRSSFENAPWNSSAQLLRDYISATPPMLPTRTRSGSSNSHHTYRSHVSSSNNSSLI
eukprot:gene12789-17146_t